jgi:hypothetical protein
LEYCQLLVLSSTAVDVNLVAHLGANSSQVIGVRIDMALVFAFVATFETSVALLLANGLHRINVALHLRLVVALGEKLFHDFLANKAAFVCGAGDRQRVHARLQLPSDDYGAITALFVTLLLALVLCVGAGPLALCHALHVHVVCALDVTQRLAVVAALQRHIAWQRAATLWRNLAKVCGTFHK